MTLPCIVCDKPLESAFGKLDVGVENQPYDATAFTTHGHYGSTAFDCDGGHLEINICTPCLVSKKDKVFHVTEQLPIVKQQYNYQIWGGPFNG